MRKAMIVAAALLAHGWLAGSTASARAEDGSAPAEQLDALVREALLANPQVARARELWRAQQSRVPYVGALDDPVLELGLDDQPFDSSLRGSRELALSQAFPFPGKRSLMTQTADWEEKAARELALETARDVVTQVKLAYFDLYMLERQASTLRESDRALRDMIEVTRARYETGVAGQSDLLLAQVERASLDGDIRHLDAQVGAARAKLNLLLARPADAELGRIDVTGLSPFSATLEQLTASAQQSRPLLRAAERELDAAGAAERLARISARPDFMVGAGYMQRPGMEDEWRAAIGITLPVWKGRKQDALAREAARRSAAAARNLENERNQVGISIREQYAHVSAEREIVGLYDREILPQAELAYSSARANYLTGQVTFLVLLESLRKWIELRRMYYEFLADSEMHLAWLEQAAGADLSGTALDLDAALADPPQGTDRARTGQAATRDAGSPDTQEKKQ